MKNYVSTGEIIDMVAPAGGVVSGQAYAINDCVVVAQINAVAGATFPALVSGCVDLPKASTDAIPAGTRLFWDNSAKLVSLSNGAGNRIGFAASTAALGTTKVRVLFYALS